MINDFKDCHGDQTVKSGEYQTKTAKDYYELFKKNYIFIL